MHDCPECGQACYCHGDIDDICVETEDYIYQHCVCSLTPPPDGCGMDLGFEEDDVDEWPDQYPEDLEDEALAEPPEAE